MAEEKITKAAKIKKKKWIQILANKLLENKVIGEIYTTEPNLLLGRSITVNLMTLTGDMKKQNTDLRFVVSGIEEGKANTELHGYFLVPASVKRLVRRGKERIDMSFACQTADNKTVRIKPLMILNMKIKGSISADLKKAVFDCLTEHISKMSFENIVTELLDNNLQREVKDHIKKIYPIKMFSVCAFYIDTKKK